MNTLEQTPTKAEIQMLYTPKEITRDIESTSGDKDMASFDYYTGKRYAELMGLIQGDNFNQVSAGTHFIVCCGDVMCQVNQTDYPEIERRVF